VLFLLSAGCGKAGPEFVEVSGTVSLGGKPLEKIHVEFYPEITGPRSSGITDANGRFTLQTADGLHKGAVMGKHRVVMNDVSIIKETGFGRDFEDKDITGGQKPRILQAYGSPTASQLSADVQKAGQEFTFELDPNPAATK
jgi:hypothetical protein